MTAHPSTISSPGASIFEAAPHLRRTEGLPRLSAQIDWHDTGRDVLDLSRGDAMRCLVNLGGSDIPLPEGRILLASLPGIVDTLPPDAAVWLGPVT
ncbi:MAG: DUF3459 domain-containing protein [Kineosporiaceae bacterium]|nr:DUF3459 domain-containing protein [Kineosporiaceae bacterium]